MIGGEKGIMLLSIRIIGKKFENLRIVQEEKIIICHGLPLKAP